MNMNAKKINFKQPKYMLPAILYLPILFVGYMLIKTFNTGTVDTTDSHLKTTDYLSSDLPEAYVDSTLGSKMENTEREYGRFSDLSGVESVEDDRDSVNKKEIYESRYSGRDSALVIRQQAKQAKLAEQKKLRAMQERVRQEKKTRSSNGDFVLPVSDSEIARVERMRRQRDWDNMERDLSEKDSYTASRDRYPYSSQEPGGNSYDGTNYRGYDDEGRPLPEPRTGNNSSTGEEEEEPEKVVKKVKTTSDYFNTIGGSQGQSKLITAIIDENIKAVDGSRVRLRLLDDIEIGDAIVKKGTYLYATMSGFGKQRVNGKVESIFFNDEIMKVSLSIYDTDGMEGLYVPLSSFRETAKDVVSSATQGGNIMDNTSSGTGIKNWANQAVQNASQRVMTALGQAAKKNKVKLKYGTRVYLVDGSQREKKGRNNK